MNVMNITINTDVLQDYHLSLGDFSTTTFYATASARPRILLVSGLALAFGLTVLSSGLLL